MSFLGSALGVISSGLQIAGAVSSLTQKNKEEKAARDAAQAAAQQSTEAQKWQQLLARAMIPGTTEHAQYYTPYLNMLREKQYAQQRQLVRDIQREEARRALRGGAYGSGARRLSDADRENMYYNIDSPANVLARHGLTGEQLVNSANMVKAYPGAALAAGNLQQDVRSQNAAGYPLLAEATRGLIPTANSFANILSGQSSGAPYSTAGNISQARSAYSPQDFTSILTPGGSR